LGGIYLSEEEMDAETDSEVVTELNSESTEVKRPGGSKRWVRIIMILIILFVIIGIGSHLYLIYKAASSLEVSEVKVDSITSRSFSDYDVTFTITIKNPTSTTLEVERLTYLIYLEDDFLGSGEKIDFEINPGSAEYSFVVRFNIYDLDGTARQLFLTDSATLTINGDATVPVKMFGAWKISSITVPYEHDEEISA
jgi:LEA14-like dessication related protein